MNPRASLLMTGTLIASLALPCVVRAHRYDSDDREDRVEWLDRDIAHDQAEIRHQQRDLRGDYRRLEEEEREGDWGDAARIRRDIQRDEQALRREQRDVRRDHHQRRELEEDDD